MSKRVFLLGVGLALVSLAFAFTDWALGIRPGVTEANARRILPGMKMRDVEAILGSGGKSGGIIAHAHGRRCREEWWWEGETGCVWIEFDGRVRSYSDPSVLSVLWVPTQSPRSPLEQLRSWLGW
jgi:hypothetical protein